MNLGPAKTAIRKQLKEWGSVSERDLLHYGDRYGRITKKALARNHRMVEALAEMLATGEIVEANHNSYEFAPKGGES